jgi:hypothetical protein
MFATPPAKYVEDSSGSPLDKCLSHFTKANSRALKAWNEVIDGTPPASAITANRQGFWKCTMETVCQLETVLRQSGTKEARRGEHQLVIKVADSKRMITLTTHMKVMTPEDAYRPEQAFEGFKVTDRFHLAASSGHPYDLAQLAFGATHSKKAMAMLAKGARRLMPEGSAETAILTTYGVHITDGDGDGITSILPLSSTVVHSTSIPRRHLALMHHIISIRLADARMTGTRYEWNSDGSFGNIKPNIKPSTSQRCTVVDRAPVPPPPSSEAAKRAGLVMIQLGLSGISHIPSCTSVFAEWLHQKGLPQDTLQALTLWCIQQGGEVDKATEAVIEAVEAKVAMVKDNIAEQRGKEVEDVHLIGLVLVPGGERQPTVLVCTLFCDIFFWC